ncbi:hypothetical protein L3X37_04635 [Sabulilitoribacter arenilitoris]|uniref:Uncharacterized protein n=1 Tax=Wocania arenilitoris TaxID=2044858 RepID=A0AAE3JMD3_9FLAO|nr:hypothetical protein [Wocania arenilitoris]MCF7567651.1 hypothetical protein [Wocania arenilitoris]
MKRKFKTRTNSLLKLKKKVGTVISVLLSLAIINLSVSCSYFTVKNVPTTKETLVKEIKTFNETKKYVVIHSINNSWHLDNMVINEDEQNISGTITPINFEHQYQKSRESKRVHRYKQKITKPLDEIHFYLKSARAFEFNKTVNIALSDIESISVNDKNTGRTIANIALTKVGTVFVAALLYAALKSSCPFVYIKNGEKYDFMGELYPGIITANMQVDDYLPLTSFSANTGEYVLKVTNQLKEIQHTDMLQLQVINHGKDVKVILDAKGQVQTFKNIEAPTKVILGDGSHSKTEVLKKDNVYYGFNTLKQTSDATRSVTFTFSKKEDNNKAKLYLTAKNSVWLDYIFGKFNEKFGMYYGTFQKEQQYLSADEMNKWANAQNIPLSIYLKTRHGWKLVEQIKTVGPMATRDMAVAINLDEVEGAKVQIKLETGFMFWEVDYVGMDFSDNIDLSINQISPSEAIDQNGNNVTSFLLENDKKYFTQPNMGDEVIVKFSAEKPEPGLTQTVFLKNRGYYNYIRDYKGVPDFEKLQGFREDNTFTRFSEKAYFDFANFDSKTLSHYE